MIPTFSEIKPYVCEALDFCLETGVGFGGMIGQGGYPPCMLDGDLRYYRNVLDKVFRSEDSSEQFYKSEKCKECSFDSYCLGPRRSYVEHYGDAEIRPFHAEIAPPARRPRRRPRRRRAAGGADGRASRSVTAERTTTTAVTALHGRESREPYLQRLAGSPDAAHSPDPRRRLVRAALCGV